MKNKRDVDFVTPRIILDSIIVTRPTLLMLMNEMLKEGVVPDVFKESTVCVVPKTPKPTTAEEYRTINMLITLEKLMESIVKEQLIEHIERNELLSECQSGYSFLYTPVKRLLIW